MKISLNVVCEYVRKASYKELKAIQDVISSAKQAIAANKAAVLSIEDYAKFSLKDGSVLYGKIESSTGRRVALTITRIKGFPRRKGAVVGSRWTVDPNLVTAVDKKFALKKER